MSPVYDPEKEKTLEPHSPERKGYHDDLGVHPERREAEVADLEKAFGAPDAKKESRAEKGEKGKLGENSDDDFWEGDDETKQKGNRRVHRRRIAAGGGAAAFLGGGIVTLIFLFASGPGQLLHFGSLLTQFHFGDSDIFTSERASGLIRRARTINNPEGAASRNLSYFGDKIARHYLTRLNTAGIDFEYNRTGRISAITVDPETEEGRRTLRDIDSELKRTTVTIDTPEGPRTVTRINLEDTRATVRRGVITAAVDSLGLNKVSNAMAARLLKIRGGVNLHPLQNISRAADEKFANVVDKVRQRDKTYIEEGSNTSLQADTNNTDAEPDAAKQADDAAAEADEILKAAQSPEASTSTKAQAIRTGVGAGFGAAGLAATVCGLKSMGDAIGELQNSNVVKPLIRNGMQIISIASQIRTGQDVNLEEVGAIAQSLYDEQNKTSWLEAESIQAELGNPGVGKEMDSSAIPSTEKPIFFAKLDTVLGVIPNSGEVCSAVQTTAGQIVITTGSILASATGFGSLAVAVGSEFAQNYLVGEYGDDVIRWMAGAPVSGDVAGAALGNYANYGAFLANNDRMFSLGGRLMSRSETAQLRERRLSEQKEIEQKKSFYARVFDLENPNSVAAKAIYENPSFASSSNTAVATLQAPSRSVASILTNFSSILVPKSSAYSTFDYGVPAVNYSLAEQESDIFAEDPYENAAVVEANLPAWHERFAACTGVEIDDKTGQIETTNTTSYQNRNTDEALSECDKADANGMRNEDYLRYSLWQGDMIIAQTLTCLPEGLDEMSCSNLGFENEADSAEGGLGDPNAEGIVDILPWLDAGAGCHKSIADNVKRMLEAAERDGVVLRGACWRSSEAQVELRKKNCGNSHYEIYEASPSSCNPPTARPESSNHEKGLAIDFRDCGTRSTACYQWLAANAAAYGMYNLPSESWHWSEDGG